MPTSLTDYLDIERMLAQKLQQELVGVLDITWSAHAQAVSTGDLDTAAYLAETMSLASVEPKIREYAKLLMRAAIDFGASLASGGRTLTSSLMLDRTVDANVNQLCNYLKYGMTLQLQKHLLQLIAQDRVVHKSEGKGHAFHGNQYVDLSLSMTKDLIESAPSTPKIRQALRDSIPCFDRPTLTTKQKEQVFSWKTGNSNVLKDPEFIDMVEGGRVLKDITVYRAGSTSDSQVLEFSVRKDKVQGFAEDMDRLMVEVHLKVGDAALFIPFVTTHHISEVGVLLPPSTMKKVHKFEYYLQKAEALRTFTSFSDRADELSKMVSGLHTSRLSGWGFTAEAEMLGLTTYKLSAQLDNRTSKFCRFIHGKVFTVESAFKVLNAAVYADDPESLKSIQPWPDQSNASMESIQALTPQQLQDRGYGVPPFHPGPVSEDTEFLSNSGWKLVKDAVVGELAFSLSPTTGLVEWVPIVKVIHAGPPPNGRMVHFTSQNSDLLVTEYHDQVHRVYRRNGSLLKVHTAGELQNLAKVTIPRTGGWVGVSTDMSIPMVRLLALWISDGCCIKKGKTSYYITIHTRKYRDLAKDLLEAATDRPAYIRDDYVECYSTELGKYLLEYVGSGFMKKRIPLVIMEAPSEVITEFLNTYLVGDGSVCGTESRYGKSVNKVFYTSSPMLAAQLGELIVKVGGCPSYSTQDNTLNPQYIGGRKIESKHLVHRIRWSISKNATFGLKGKGDIQYVDYSGSTYCITLARNHVFFVRRNGKCIWTGNCRTLMVKVDYKTRMVKPPVRSASVLPEYTSTAETFSNLGLKIPQRKISIWNDYVGLDPAVVLSMLSGKSIPDLLGNANGMISITAKDNILLSWGEGRGLTFVPGTGSIYLSKVLAAELVSAKELELIKSFGTSVVADDINVAVAEGQAIKFGRLGFTPAQIEWLSVKAQIGTALTEYLVSGESLSANDQVAITRVLDSMNPLDFKTLFSSGITTQVLDALLYKVQYKGVLSLDATGLSS